jgi:hypothetical protein
MLHKYITSKNVKSFFNRGYGHAKKFVSSVDKAFQTGKQIYQIAEPLLQGIAPSSINKLNKHIVKGIGDYEGLRSKVMETNDDVVNKVSQIAGKLKSQNIKLPGIN